MERSLVLLVAMLVAIGCWGEWFGPGELRIDETVHLCNMCFDIRLVW